MNTDTRSGGDPARQILDPLALASADAWSIDQDDVLLADNAYELL
jgi:hypothetical protein